MFIREYCDEISILHRCLSQASYWRCKMHFRLSNVFLIHFHNVLIPLFRHVECRTLLGIALRVAEIETSNHESHIMRKIGQQYQQPAKEIEMIESLYYESSHASRDMYTARVCKQYKFPHTSKRSVTTSRAGRTRDSRISRISLLIEFVQIHTVVHISVRSTTLDFILSGIAQHAFGHIAHSVFLPFNRVGHVLRKEE